MLKREEKVPLCRTGMLCLFEETYLVNNEDTTCSDDRRIITKLVMRLDDIQLVVK